VRAGRPATTGTGGGACPVRSDMRDVGGGTRVSARRRPRTRVVLVVIVLVGLSIPFVRMWALARSADRDPVLVGAGDIADCASTGDEATARLVAALPDATVITTGDNAYPSGAHRDYAECYEPTWGAHRDRTRPVPGNHEYRTPGAAGYFHYFGDGAGEPGQAYYSYDLGEWHLIALDSNCGAVGGCGPTSPQGQWLREDLATHPGNCTLAYWHHPRFSSGGHGDVKLVRPLWQALYKAGADVVLNGHDHVYESFEPQDPDGIADERGLRQFTIGTGGAESDVFGTIRPNSRERHTGTAGVFTMTLRPGGYDWEFVPAEPGGFADSGSAACVIEAPRSGNLVRNAGFEADADADTRPDDWTTDVRLTRDPAAARAGKQGGRLEASPSSTPARHLSQDIEDLRAGAIYDFSSWVAVPADAAAGLEWDIVWRDAEGDVITETNMVTTRGTGTWQQVLGAATAPAGTASAELRMIVPGPSGTVDVDDVSLVRR
jgi:Calcineurin-like phosphoesterase